MSGPAKWHHLRAITVENHAPDAADLRRLMHRAGGDPAKAQKVVHHVFLHLPQRLPVRSSGHHLWIGDREIPQYTSFSGGISFRAHDAADLARLYGKPIRFISDAGRELHTGVAFPNLSQHLTRSVGQRLRKIYRR